MNDKFKRFKESLKRDKLVNQREEIVAGLTEMTDEQKAQRLKMAGDIAHVINVVQGLTNPLTEETKPIVPPSESIKTFIQEEFAKIPVQNDAISDPTIRGNVSGYDDDDIDLYIKSGAYQDQVDLAKEQLQNYNSSLMPLGLREAQERNGVADHGLGIYQGTKLIKGNFEWNKDKSAVIWVPSATGVFTVLDPLNLSEGSKNFLDRKFSDVPYKVGEDIVYMPKAIVEPDLTERKSGVDPFDNHELKSVDVISGKIYTEMGEPKKLNFGKSKREEMTEKVEAYKEGKERIIQNEETHHAFVAATEAAEIKGFEPEVKTPKEVMDESIKAVKIAAQVNMSCGQITEEEARIIVEGKAYIGIDPGKQGGIVAIGPRGIIGKWIIPLIGDSVDANEIWTILKTLKESYDLTLVLEDVHSLFGMSAATNFSMGHTLGILDGIIAISKIRLIRTPPKTWQKEIWQKDDMQYKPLKAEQKKPSVDTKLTSMKAAMRLFPGADFRKSNRATNPHDGICDACCLAEYGRRKNL